MPRGVSGRGGGWLSASVLRARSFPPPATRVRRDGRAEPPGLSASAVEPAVVLGRSPARRTMRRPRSVDAPSAPARRELRCLELAGLDRPHDRRRTDLHQAATCSTVRTSRLSIACRLRENTSVISLTRRGAATRNRLAGHRTDWRRCACRIQPRPRLCFQINPRAAHLRICAAAQLRSERSE